MSPQTFRCCPHCTDDQPHIEQDTHEVPCTLCYGDVERHTAAIAEAAREYVRVLDAWACGEGVSRATAWYALIAAIDAEREAQSRPGAHTNPQP